MRASRRKKATKESDESDESDVATAPLTKRRTSCTHARTHAHGCLDANRMTLALLCGLTIGSTTALAFSPIVTGDVGGGPANATLAAW